MTYAAKETKALVCIFGQEKALSETRTGHLSEDEPQSRLGGADERRERRHHRRRDRHREGVL